MKVVVCVRQGLDGELGPFDAAAYEAALRLPDAEVTLLSMGPPAAKELLLRLTRLGAKNAVLLSDPAFAGADTLATAYALSLAINRLAPDLIICGRQTLIGDTAQTGTMLSVLTNTEPICNVLEIEHISDREIVCKTRDADRVTGSLPALLTVERIHTLRLPSIRSKTGEVTVLSCAALGADPLRCGLAGSPTRVLKTAENAAGRRRCKWITLKDLPTVVAEAKRKATQSSGDTISKGAHAALKKVFSVGNHALSFAEEICDDVTLLSDINEEKIIDRIKAEDPDAVIWASDTASKTAAARVAARLGLGLCADCTALETDGSTLYMIRPALAGSVIATVKSNTRPAMATVRTTQKDTANVLLAVGYGARHALAQAKTLAGHLGADIAASRKAVDNDLAPYEKQVGLTGRSVCPAVYIAVGISGAVHHIVGMERAGTVIAINPDKNAPIFDYADYGILARAEEIEL